MYDFNLIFVILSTYLTMHIYSWNRILHLNYIIWCYYARYSLYDDIMEQLNYALLFCEFELYDVIE
jgi:hypothetical protein